MSENLESHFRKVIGGDDAEKEKILREAGEVFNIPQHLKELEPHLVELAERDRKILQDVETTVDALVASYGGEPLKLPENKLHVVKDGAIYKITEGEARGGLHWNWSQEIAIERLASDVGFALIAAHEMFHLKSFKSILIDKKVEAEVFQSGVSLYLPEAELFGELEEAIVAECTRKLHKALAANPLFSTEVAATEQAKERLRPWFIKILKEGGFDEGDVAKVLDEIFSLPVGQELFRVLEGSETESYKLGYLQGALHRLMQDGSIGRLERMNEREKLNTLLDEILEKSNGRFLSRDEVFKEFAKANFTGDLKPLVRLFNETLGEGEFAKAAKSFSGSSHK